MLKAPAQVNAPFLSRCTKFQEVRLLPHALNNEDQEKKDYGLHILPSAKDAEGLNSHFEPPPFTYTPKLPLAKRPSVGGE